MSKVNITADAGKREEGMSREVMEYMVWVIEIASRRYFGGDKGKTYRALRACEIWDLYIRHYEITHTLGAEVILEEIGEMV